MLVASSQHWLSVETHILMQVCLTDCVGLCMMVIVQVLLARENSMGTLRDRLVPATEPHIYWIERGAGIAGQYAYSARVGYEGEAPREVMFIGSEYGGPVVMRTEAGEVFVTDPGRFGEFGRDWVRRFFAA